MPLSTHDPPSLSSSSSSPPLPPTPVSMLNTPASPSPIASTPHSSPLRAYPRSSIRTRTQRTHVLKHLPRHLVRQRVVEDIKFVFGDRVQHLHPTRRTDDVPTCLTSSVRSTCYGAAKLSQARAALHYVNTRRSFSLDPAISRKHSNIDIRSARSERRDSRSRTAIVDRTALVLSSSCPSSSTPTPRTPSTQRPTDLASPSTPSTSSVNKYAPPSIRGGGRTSQTVVL
ncbi:hypothetical protein NLJ89_g9940 [Agrocybe chaxingu]|uniref:Uncharacterized protein n=1 Tax=Agrocybe chaxingu TaxID=84603 RepID=A0A9W8MQR3_9AGAR|nr:hypothetical protein NLJ89_g9940 [Agrocybe chaxingu]